MISLGTRVELSWGDYHPVVESQLLVSHRGLLPDLFERFHDPASQAI
jgi:hypothetical protein